MTPQWKHLMLRLLLKDLQLCHVQVHDQTVVDILHNHDEVQAALVLVARTHPPVLPTSSRVVEEPKVMLQNLKGVERQIWAQVGDRPRIVPIADEDMERENEEKTSSVHFLRYEFSADDVAALRAGEPFAMGIDNPHIQPNSVLLEDPVRSALIADFA